MNTNIIFLSISLGILALSLIIICTSPIINNIEITIDPNNNIIWKPSKWRTINCKFFSDKLSENELLSNVDEIQKLKKLKNLCIRQNIFYETEHISPIYNIIFGFVCAYLSFLQYFNIGINFKKKTAIIVMFFGLLCFIVTFINVIYSGYIFTNDVAYGIIEIDSTNLDYHFIPGVEKLYSNGAMYKNDGTNLIKISHNDKRVDAEYIKYYELGQSQYNYKKEYFELYNKNKPSGTSSNQCNINKDTISYSGSCEYYFWTPPNSYENQYIYNTWLTTLILSVILFLGDIAIIIFGCIANNGDNSADNNSNVITYQDN